MPQDHLEDPYRSHTIDLGQDEEGPVVATLISRTDSPKNGPAVLYIHGFSDYFFHPHLADYFIARGYAFYALDLRKAGRSLRPHQTPHYVRHVAQYFAELDLASKIIRGHGHGEILLYAHSAGGLAASLWAHRLRHVDWLQGLVLNSPFLGIDLNDLALKLAMAPIDIIGLLAPKLSLPKKGTSVNVVGLHAEFRGEWDFNLEWKPHTGTPIRLGWLRGIRRAQRRIHRGLDIRVPVLVAVAKTSLRVRNWTSHSDVADTVLDSDGIVRWAPKLGKHVEVTRVAGARHDLALSKAPARESFFASIDSWRRRHALGTQAAATDNPVILDPHQDLGANVRSPSRRNMCNVGENSQTKTVADAQGGGFACRSVQHCGQHQSPV